MKAKAQSAQASPNESEARSLAREYYVRLDSGRDDLLDLFADDAEFYFPKFGIGVGKRAFGELVAGLLTQLESIQHDIDNLKFVVDGDTVAVEGTTHGRLRDGTTWRGGETPAGRFASTFDVRGGLITRMYVYLDPDYGSRDKAGFWWDQSNRRW